MTAGAGTRCSITARWWNDESGGQSAPSRVHRVTGKTEEGAGNDQGPAAMTRW